MYMDLLFLLSVVSCLRWPVITKIHDKTPLNFCSCFINMSGDDTFKQMHGYKGSIFVWVSGMCMSEEKPWKIASQ
jgi:hypothetical protein